MKAGLMKARDAENRIAELLTDRSISPQLKERLNGCELVGFQRARPIYQKKVMLAAKGRNPHSGLWRRLLRVFGLLLKT